MIFRKSAYHLLSTVFLIFVDQITKLIFNHRDFFVGPLRIHPMKNYGLSFSLDFGLTFNLILIALGLLFFIYYFWRNTNLSKLHLLALVLILSGAVSNIIDRFYFGYVRDFLDLGLGFTFNLADVLIVLGLVLLLTSSEGGDSSPQQ